MIITSWNVNGIRAVYNKEAFQSYINAYDPDILFLQETKAHPEQLPEDLLSVSGYHTEWIGAEKKGYSSVAVLTKEKPLSIISTLNIPKFDTEARIIGLEFTDKVIFGVYFPNSQREGRLDYKFEFYTTFFDMCQEYQDQGKDIIVSGDFNTAHTEIDLARPKENEESAGFLPEERAWMDKLFTEMGYIDTFRHFHPQEKNHYTWWSYRGGARDRNVGWRIDYVIVNQSFIHKVKNAFIHHQVKGSDHCPVGIEI